MNDILRDIRAPALLNAASTVASLLIVSDVIDERLINTKLAGATKKCEIFFTQSLFVQSYDLVTEEELGVREICMEILKEGLLLSFLLLHFFYPLSAFYHFFFFLVSCRPFSHFFSW